MTTDFDDLPRGAVDGTSILPGLTFGSGPDDPSVWIRLDYWNRSQVLAPWTLEVWVDARDGARDFGMTLVGYSYWVAVDVSEDGVPVGRIAVDDRDGLETVTWAGTWDRIVVRQRYDLGDRISLDDFWCGTLEVPEPAGGPLVALGLMVLALWRKRR